jgi:hypothetical protein
VPESAVRAKTAVGVCFGAISALLARPYEPWQFEASTQSDGVEQAAQRSNPVWIKSSFLPDRVHRLQAERVPFKSKSQIWALAMLACFRKSEPGAYTQSSGLCLSATRFPMGSANRIQACSRVVFAGALVVYSAMAQYIPKIPKPGSGKDELKKALQLHEAMSLARDANQSLVTILEILRTELVPWPSIHDLGLETEEFERARESLSNAKLDNLTRDLSIWIVDHYYQPKTLAEVKQLKSGLHQGGLECLLRYLLKQEDERLGDRLFTLLDATIEKWIDFFWKSDETELMNALEKAGVFSTGQLVAWLDETCSPSSDSLLAPVMERLKQAP